MSFHQDYYPYYCNPWQREFPSQRGFRWGKCWEESGVHVAVIGHTLYATVALTPIFLDDLTWQSQFTYCSDIQHGMHSGLGYGWFISDHPFLSIEEDARACLRLTGGPASCLTFSQDSNYEWKPEPSSAESVVHDTVDQSFIFHPQSAASLHFHNFDGDLPRQSRGRLKSLESQSGAVFGTVVDEPMGLATHLKLKGVQDDVAITYAQTLAVDEILQWSSAIVHKNGQTRERARFEYKESKLIKIVIEQFSEEWNAVSTFEFTYSSNRLTQITGTNAAAEFTKYKIRYSSKSEVLRVYHEGWGAIPKFYL